ncbi:ParB/RepB/Spo0J family partition protein [Corynebacterium pygosceleis]|uniref:ParB/RepB/Spo0J family partition protein n=1 Tax=Corynebacterium pygosceleis TaxID=2800406 RepID=A0A9Q4CAJ0_9CORY|nr:ParB/RepB/Spo0J family partition protein [Corynebacterium pygosceleis]MCK7637207.1 ParB/RepB/Spo0J family partition protein [Corynebacterium pygosceleis]MCK7676144.1 ParB/RepB/Spo0J family partition protein [Corynebacterium pygosceleis]MCL0120018.1 ParB/RepB/Spo0J family partition protein [Corynebacterium pygosceleis]MCX7445110.1 ParB/RepB/Spo0J family partition protein [Corynebacterium pygosceleis]MCX7468465.1 ParB/RepB/Spo0J family partition protein [Corynebacterium pygosceleis]
MSQQSRKGDSRRGGLGRGLAALIPDGASPARPRLGDGAASILMGEQRSQGTGTGKTGAEGARPGGPSTGKRGKAPTAASATPDSGSSVGAVYRELPVTQIMPNPHQPRTVFDEEALGELVHSIREFGLMQPIVVRRAPDDGGWEIIMGERRWRAATRAGLTEIPAIVRDTDDGSMLRDALLENIHRVQLNPLEEAAAYQQLLEEFGVTQAQLADRIGRSRPVITNMIRLLALPVPVQRKVAAGVLSAGHARALLGLRTGAEAQASLADRIVAEGLSVRATEEAVTLLNRGDTVPERKTREKAAPPEFATLAADSLADRLDTRVTVSVGKRKGKIMVEFGDREDLERIMGLLRAGNR